MPGLKAPKEAELALAKRIIADLTGDFSINDYPDRYRKAVLALIDKKLAGEKIVYEEPHPLQPRSAVTTGSLRSNGTACGRSHRWAQPSTSGAGTMWNFPTGSWNSQNS